MQYIPFEGNPGINFVYILSSWSAASRGLKNKFIEELLVANRRSGNAHAVAKVLADTRSFVMNYSPVGN